ncbi:RT0821/Lpp0805 family surface protein [Bradyrhizobium prioriisuperbiae]|uniref:RT0821/Lpp0805 family surface protein n=1 Tax=Bradyrhizobium prioriisuperbiae TaxID=2854389 RepID=UPI0028EF6516|nr:RT0821/Lpp0805 family surface protein [Bradyrhizobium prioritasuperba]
MLKSKAVVLAVTAFALAGCAANSGPKENAGTAGGALAGALIGSAIGKGPGERVGAALAGAAIGGLIGNRIGAAMDDDDKRYAYEAQMNALETGRSGAPVAWRNPDSGRYGNIVPGPAYDQRGTKCRSFSHTIYMDGQPQIARGTACRNPDGTWTALS